jgi:vancomycin resistance protein YoaR
MLQKAVLNRRVVMSVALAGAALAAVLVLGTMLLRSACWWGDGICPGVRIGGRTLEAKADPDAMLGEWARQMSARVVEVTVEGAPDATRTLTLGELGVVLDVGRTASLVHAVGHRGSHGARFADARRASRGEVDVPLVVNVDDEAVHAALMPLKDETDQEPIPARLDLAHGGIVADVPGRFLDLDAAIEKIRAAAVSGAATIDLERVDAPPRISREFLLGVDSHELLARFQTGFSRHGDQELRAHNIETAASRLDGVVLLPHELFSFNTVVGPRTVENGFSKGWEIWKGEMVEGIGGGTCQAASTLHAAAFLSGLDIIERLPHSRPSAYITMGLDATVVYPVVDLKIRNPYAFPIVIHSYVEGNVVVFEMLGREKPARVTFGREVLATRPYTRKVEEKPGVPLDRIIRKQHGIRGYKIKRTRTIAYRDGTAKKESNVDIYWPTIELYQVAPGTDPDGKLPPPGVDLDESGTSGWAAPSLLPPPGPVAAVAPSSLPGAIAAAGVGAVGTAPPCAGDCTPPPVDGRPKIIEAPGVHAPRAEQVHAPTKIVIGGGDAARRSSQSVAPAQP